MNLTLLKRERRTSYECIFEDSLISVVLLTVVVYLINEDKVCRFLLIFNN